MTGLSADDLSMITSGVERYVENRYAFDERPQRLRRPVHTDNWRDFSELGWLAMPFAEAVGGLDASVSNMQQVLAPLGRGLIEEPYADVVLVAGKLIEQLATRNRQELLASLISAQTRFVLAHRELGSEFDPAAIHTQATRTNQGYLLSGRKQAIVFADQADTLIVSAQLENRPAFFLAPRDASGLRIQSYPTLDGRRASQIELNNVALSADVRLGEGADDWARARAVLLQCTAAFCGEALGIARALRETTADYLANRQQFGVPLSSFQALQHRFADMVIMELEIDALARLAGQAADAIDASESEAHIRRAKARIGQAGRKLAEEAVQLHGGIGVTEELIVGHYLRRMIALDAQFGTAQEHLLWLALRGTQA